MRLQQHRPLAVHLAGLAAADLATFQRTMETAKDSATGVRGIWFLALYAMATAETSRRSGTVVDVGKYSDTLWQAASMMPDDEIFILLASNIDLARELAAHEGHPFLEFVTGLHWILETQLARRRISLN